MGFFRMPFEELLVEVYKSIYIGIYMYMYIYMNMYVHVYIAHDTRNTQFGGSWA